MHPFWYELVHVLSHQKTPMFLQHARTCVNMWELSSLLVKGRENFAGRVSGPAKNYGSKEVLCCWAECLHYLQCRGRISKADAMRSWDAMHVPFNSIKDWTSLTCVAYTSLCFCVVAPLMLTSAKEKTVAAQQVVACTDNLLRRNLIGAVQPGDPKRTSQRQKLPAGCRRESFYTARLRTGLTLRPCKSQRQLLFLSRLAAKVSNMICRTGHDSLRRLQRAQNLWGSTLL